jgi:uncharacterized membrane protein YesL
MGGVWTVIKWGLRNWYDEMVLFVAVGLVAFVFQLPFAVVAYVVLLLPPELFPIGVPMLMPFLPSPALVGLYALTRQLANNEGVSWTLFWSSIRQYFRRALAIFVVSTAVTLLLRVAVGFYVSDTNPVLNLIGYALLYLLIFWLILQLYVIPLLLEQERWNLVRLYRNAFVVMAVKPVLSLILFIISFIIVVLGMLTFIGMPIIAMPMIAVLSGHALHYAVYGPPQKPQ